MADAAVLYLGGIEEERPSGLDVAANVE